MTDVADLIARMLTCAAYLEQRASDQAIRDAIALLGEAAEALKRFEPPAAPEPLGEPMPLLEPLPAKTAPSFTDPGVPALPREGNHRGCPRCGSRTCKKLTRGAGGLMATCPVCDHSWKLVPRAVWT